MKKMRLWLVVVGIILIGVGILSLVIFKQRSEEKRRIEKENNLIVKIKSHYDENVISNKDSYLYRKDLGKYVKIGKIAKDEPITLEKIKINEKTKYFYIPKLKAYISYKDVVKSDKKLVLDTRYQKYLPFNSNVETRDNFSLYRNGKVIYTFYAKEKMPILEKAEDGYYVQYLGERLFIYKKDILNIYDSNNTNLEEAVSVPVTVYHFIYLEGDNSCNEGICHSDKQIREHFKYLRENDYFTITTKELRLFLEGKIRLPKKSILVTIDDGARAENFIPLLEEYQINATLFLVSSWYPKEKFKSDYMELASHTNNLHTPGVCPGGQGSPLKCLNKTELVNDLKKSREILDGTEAFCFPFYEFNAYGIEAVKEAGFKLGFIGGMRRVTKNVNPYMIPRISLSRYTTLDEYINYVSS